MIGKIETPTTRETSDLTPRNKKRKNKKPKESPKETKEDVIQFGENVGIPTKEQVSTPRIFCNECL